MDRPGVSRLVELKLHGGAGEVDDVGGAGAVDVGEAIRRRRRTGRNGRRAGRVHGDFGAEAAVAEVGPVADFAVADADEVGEAVAAHVGEKDGLGAVGQNEAGPLSSSNDGRLAPAGAKPSSTSPGYQVNTSSSVISTSEGRRR